VTADRYISALTIAGSDPTGGAGLQGDLKTFAAHGVVGSAVVAAITVQDRSGVRAVRAVEGEVVGGQLLAALGALRPRAVKTGMLWSAGAIRAVAAALGTSRAPLVVDPVLTATAGGDLLEPGALPVLVEALLPRATVLTPNLPEAARLLGVRGIAKDEAEDAARRLRALGPSAVLLKGGHGEGPEAVDLLATANGVRRFALPRLSRGAHGTGCALSAALAANLAKGLDLAAAVERAKSYVHRALAAAAALGPDAPLVHAV
jgi:hydroxymethylpyrimidine/phosphomethylpyrimidine kinase